MTLPAALRAFPHWESPGGEVLLSVPEPGMGGGASQAEARRPMTIKLCSAAFADFVIDGRPGTTEAAVLVNRPIPCCKEGSGVPSLFAARQTRHNPPASVDSVMCRPVRQLQVLRAIISSLSVLVVDNFCAREGPPQDALHDDPVFVPATVGPVDFGSQLDVPVANALPRLEQGRCRTSSTCRFALQTTATVRPVFRKAPAQDGLHGAAGTLAAPVVFPLSSAVIPNDGEAAKGSPGQIGYPVNVPAC